MKVQLLEIQVTAACYSGIMVKDVGVGKWKGQGGERKNGVSIKYKVDNTRIHSCSEFLLNIIRLGSPEDIVRVL